MSFKEIQRLRKLPVLHPLSAEYMRPWLFQAPRARASHLARQGLEVNSLQIFADLCRSWAARAMATKERPKAIPSRLTPLTSLNRLPPHRALLQCDRPHHCCHRGWGMKLRRQVHVMHLLRGVYIEGYIIQYDWGSR